MMMCVMPLLPQARAFPTSRKSSRSRALATLNLPGDGIGLRYHFGLFRQSFADGLQNELPDPWLNEHSWAEKTDITYPVTLAGKPYTARLYKLAVTGYGHH
mgnify:CR=1 FL=1